MAKKKEVEEKRASVSYKLGLTLSMGNYETARVDIGITEPCHEEDIDKTFKKIKRKVEIWMDKEVKKFRQ